ncbi:shieldin complex subunit 1 isoform X5 [Delphinapterus leucas]|uniref:Shieldin complex subunit 1 isoform X5 n=2 Tax=Delphinapterus leucas TaxID=9749 RepID=A0A2Y9LYQ8_DELLE|nr:shieldin complex subunit 1 isoform X5 [Delphinapterus leucas]
MSTTACDWVSSNERCLARTMANQEATPGSQSEESNALDLPSAYDIRDYVLQRPSQEANSEAFSSEEAFSIPCSSDTDPGTQCQFWGKQIGSYPLSPSLLKAGTELPARRKVYGGGFPYPGH